MNRTNSSRRAFFLQGGAALGAGVGAAAAATAAASVLTQEKQGPEEQLQQLRQQLDGVEDREAIRRLHRAFTTLVEQQAYEAAAELFENQADLNLSGVSAKGKRAILRMFADQYRQQNAAAMHTAYRQNASQQADTVTLSEDRTQATGTFHVEVELCVPLQADCTAAKMARLQGHMADRRWEAGRFQAKCVKTSGQWKIASLRYQTS